MEKEVTSNVNKPVGNGSSTNQIKAAETDVTEKSEVKDTTLMLHVPRTNHSVTQQEVPPKRRESTDRKSCTKSMVLAIFACVFCFCPIGVCSVCFAVSARDYAAAGHQREAEDEGSRSLGLSVLAILFGVIVYIIILLVLALPAAKS